MTEQSPRMEWGYPSREDDPWYDKFKDFAIAVDGSAFAHREDRSIIWSGGGTISWDLTTQTFGWTGRINVYSPMSAKLMQIDPGVVADWADGEIVYIDVTRLALVNVAKLFQKATSLPSTDDAMAFGVRIGDTIFLRTGISLGDGDTAAGVAPVPGGGGSALEVEDEGVSVDPAVVNMDFVGGNITATQTAPGHVQVAVTGGAASPFEDDIPNNEIQPVAASIGRSFIVGSQSMDDSGSANDERMFFDKDNYGAFRAGEVSGSQWNAVNCGWTSVAFGYQTEAIGGYSAAFNNDTVAAGYSSATFGEDTRTGPLSEGSFAQGQWSEVHDTVGAYGSGYGEWCAVFNGGESWGRWAFSANWAHTYGDNSHAVNEGLAFASDSHAEGAFSEARAQFSHAEGWESVTRFDAIACHSEGIESEAYFAGSHAAGSGIPSGTGAAHAQYQRVVQAREIPSGTVWGVPLRAGYNLGSTLADMVIPLDHSWAIDIEVIARDEVGFSGDTASFFFKCAVANKGGFVSFVGGVSPWTWLHSFKDPGAASWDCRLVLGVTTPGALEIEVLGDVSRDTAWVATIHLTEIESEAGPP